MSAYSCNRVLILVGCLKMGFGGWALKFKVIDKALNERICRDGIPKK